MRLIDAEKENEKLLDFIAEHDSGIQFAIERKDMTMLEDIFYEYFESQETAYDVDKVVERLEKISEIYCKEYNQPKGSLYLQDAIEIVKAGGVNDV